jgi:hypothetical protein
VASSTTVDAAVKKVGGPRPRPQPTDPPPPPPKATPDAGVKLDFVKKAPPLDFVKPKQ